MSMTSPARTYNQLHVPRKYIPGKRRVSIYVSWSYPGEANRDVTVMDNRFSTMTEVRRVTWPAYEGDPYGDPLVPRQQRFGLYTRSLINGLGLPVENRYGLRPALVAGSQRPVPLSIDRDADTKGWLNGVDAFNFHMHLPHYAVTSDTGAVK